MFQPIASLGVVLLAATTVLAADPVSCGLDKKCPKETPCCSREMPPPVPDVKTQDYAGPDGHGSTDMQLVLSIMRGRR